MKIILGALIFASLWNLACSFSNFMGTHNYIAAGFSTLSTILFGIASLICLNKIKKANQSTHSITGSAGSE